MVDYYQNPSHLLGSQLPGINDEDGIGAIKSALSETIQIIDGSDAEKFEKALLNVQFIEAKLNIMVEIPKVLASLRVIDLTNSDNYIIALNHLLLKEWQILLTRFVFKLKKHREVKTWINLCER